MTSSRTHSPLLGAAAVALCGLAVALTSGCTQKPQCSELGDCGGNPLGDYALGNGHPSCSEDLYTIPADPRLVKGDQTPARTPPVEGALYDWCDMLVTNGGTMISTHPARFSYEAGSIGAAWARYDGAGHYSAGITRTGTYTVDFPGYCMRAFGAMDGRPANPMKDMTTPPVDVCTQLQAQIVSASSHRNILCVRNPDDQQGCLCRFDVSDTKAGSGLYRLNGNVITHLVNTALPDMSPFIDFPSEATFCASAGGLQLTGKDGQYLFNEPGLRTLDLGKTTITCNDMMKGPGEEGVDCGAACGMACGAAAVPPAM